MMDANEQEGAQSFYNKCSSLFFNNIPLRLHLLLSMALLSFLLTFTSYNSYHYHMSAFVLPLFTHTFEKKYLFLLCTTILTFITKKNPHLGLKENMYHDKLLYSLSEIQGTTVPEMEGTIVLEGNLQEYEYGKFDEQESKEDHEQNTEFSEKESEVLMEIEEADGEVFEEEGFLGGSSRVEEEQSEMNMDTEELNKKIEEFIRKMREELRVEAEQQLITV